MGAACVRPGGGGGGGGARLSTYRRLAIPVDMDRLSACCSASRRLMCSRQTSISEEAEEAEDGDEAGEEAEAVMAEALASIKLVNFLNIGGGGGRGGRVCWKAVPLGRLGFDCLKTTFIILRRRITEEESTRYGEEDGDH